MLYEWAPAKARANIRKHGLSFDDAAAVFLDPLALTFPDPYRSHAEDREITIGHTSGHRVVFVAHVGRGGRMRNHSRAKGNQRRARTI